MAEEYLTPGEAAKILGVSERTVQRMCQERRIDHYDFGFGYRLLRREVEAWVAARHKKATTSAT